MISDSCPKCGSTERERGRIYEAGRVTDIRFKADAAPVFSYKKQVSALACSKCGYIEFYLSDDDPGDAT
jgi:predicted nucleic-acid-binding Zn-ribbon protein